MTNVREREPYIETASGRQFHLLKPQPDEVCIEDIAHSLAQQCRWTGQCRVFFCPTPDQRILRADLQWVPAGSLRLGDELIGFDETPIELGMAGVMRRRFRYTTVTALQPVERPTVLLEMADGSTVHASSEHPWLVATKTSRNQKWLPSAQIMQDVNNGSRRYMHRFMNVWEQSNNYEDGRLAGLFDGEGYLSFENRRGTQLGIGQNPGLVLDFMRFRLSALSFKYGESNTGRYRVKALHVHGGWREIARLLGTIRPMRLLAKFQEGFRAGLFDKQMDGIGRPLEIVRGYHHAARLVIGIETSTHTYLCEGFGAHNSVAEHSRNVSFACEPEDALWGLLHDAPEAYLSDLSAPLKHSGLFDNYRRVEAEVMKAICIHFGLLYREGNLAPASVERADREMLYREAVTLMPAKWVPQAELVVPLFNYGLEPVAAEKDFLLRYDQLRKEKT